jgi:hypothetical protein
VPIGEAAVAQTISHITAEIGVPSGKEAPDRAALRAARAATSALRRQAFRPLLVDTALRILMRGRTVRAATHRTTYMAARGALGVGVSLDLSPAAEEEDRALDANTLRFPVLYQDDRSKLTFILNAGAGHHPVVEVDLPHTLRAGTGVRRHNHLGAASALSPHDAGPCRAGR